jgi:DNA-binding response OmpR family regulator
MVVDDEQDIVNTVKIALKSQGYQVEGYTDPRVAVQEFSKNDDRYALVISDIRMPGMSGFEFARSIKAARPDAALVLMTAFEINKPEFSSLFPSTIISDLVTKPFTNVQLFRIVRKYVGITEQL